MSRVMCPLTCFMGHVSFFLPLSVSNKVVELFGGGSGINGDTLFIQGDDLPSALGFGSINSVFQLKCHTHCGCCSVKSSFFQVQVTSLLCLVPPHLCIQLQLSYVYVHTLLSVYTFLILSYTVLMHICTYIAYKNHSYV